MREIGFESDQIHADAIAIGEPRLIIEYATQHAILDIGRRCFGESRAEGIVDPFLPQLVHTFHHVGHPTDLTFGVGDREVGESRKRPGEDEIDQRTHRVLERQRRADDEGCVGRCDRHP